MGILIDTTVLIDLERSKGTFETQKDVDCFISVITASELLHGVYRAKNQQIQNRRLAYVESILELIPIFPIDLPVSRVHAQITAELAKAGNSIKINDSWIAATGIAHGLTVVTRDKKDFPRVPGLDFEIW